MANKYLKRLCLSASYHGLKFPFLPRRSRLEKFFWMVVIWAALFCWLIVGFQQWAQFQEKRVNVYFQTIHYNVWETHFPAVSICSNNDLDKHKVHDLATKIHKNMYKDFNKSVEEIEALLRYLNHLSNFGENPDTLLKNYTYLQDILEFANLSVEEVYKDLTPKCEGMLYGCFWKGIETNCNKLFEVMATPMGFCCIFNFHGFNKHNHTHLSKGSLKPLRVSSCGPTSALIVILNNNFDDYYATTMGSIGFRILVHHPYDFPDFSSENVLLSMGEVALSRIAFRAVRADPDMRNLNPNIRSCSFKDEQKLGNLVYSHSNCMLYCRLKIIHQLCSCVPFYYRDILPTSERVRVCTLRDQKCLHEYIGIILSSVPGRNGTIKTSEKDFVKVIECDNCLWNCRYIWYDINVSTSPYHARRQGVYNLPQNLSQFRLFYNNFAGEKRVIRYNSLMVFVYGSAGLASLFVGFNYGFIFEFLYCMVYQPIRKLFHKNVKKQKDVKRNLTLKNFKLGK